LKKIATQNPYGNFQGHDTTAAAMTWAMQEIGQHPEVLKELHKEVELVFGDSDRPATMEDLDKLTVCALF
jgi:cytochrome P450